MPTTVTVDFWSEISDHSVFRSRLSPFLCFDKARPPPHAVFVLVSWGGIILNTWPDRSLRFTNRFSGTDRTLQWMLVRVPGREFRFLAPIAGQHLCLNLNQLILWRRIRICLLSFRIRQSCECCQTNGFARPVLRDRVSLATKVTCATAHSKVCSFCPHFRLFCSIIINFSKKHFCSPMIEVRILNRR